MSDPPRRRPARSGAVLARSISFAAAITITITIGIAAGCSSGNDGRTDPIVAGAADVERSGVGIVAEGCGPNPRFGSGVVLSVEGQIVTVAHTLQGATEVVVIDAGGDEHVADVVAFDKDADLAVLHSATLTAPPLGLGEVATGPGSALVWTRDSGVSELALDVTKRLAVTIEDIYGDGKVRRAAVEVSAEIEVGNSGGPILDEMGEVIGIIYAASTQREGVGFAVDATEIERALLSVEPVGVGTGPCP